MSDIRKARCLCDAVTFTARIVSNGLQACHCRQCQRWTGGGPLFVVRTADVKTEGEEAIATYRASDWGERGFCAICGTTLYWRMQGGDLIILPVGLFDDQSGFEMKEEIFVDRRPGWMPPWTDAAQSTEAEQRAILKAHLEGNGL